MNRLKSILGYTWVSLALLIVLVTFIGNDTLSRRLVSATGLTVSPWMTGGAEAETIDHGAYRTVIRRPVFDGLVGKRSTGFVQIEWESKEKLPVTVEEPIELRSEKGARFTVRLDTRAGTAVVENPGGSILGVERVYRLDNGFAVRVALRRDP
jgi:hypothetical protein